MPPANDNAAIGLPGEIILPYPPSTNRLWRNFNGRMVKSAEARAYATVAAEAARRAGITAPLDGDVAVSIILHPKRPKRYKGGPVRCIDLDNAAKAALDAIQGIAYVNDNQIVSLKADKMAPCEGGGLRVRVSQRWHTLT